MPRFRKKPVVIEAVQFNGKNDLEVSAFVGENGYDPTENGPSWVIRTLEGEMRADPGDWIIKGVQGEFYPCKPDIFEATYEAVEDDTSLPEDYWETAQ
jgi:hypothetical protein